MRNFYILFQQEIYKWAHRPSTYFIATLFLLLMGFNFIYILFLNTQSAEPFDCLQMFFEIFWLPTLFVIPIITMRTLSEEQRSGLLESTLSTPISISSLVISKFAITYLFYLLLWGFSLLFPFFTQYCLKETLMQPLITPTVLQGGMVFIISTGFLFIAIGVFASSLTRTPTLACFLCFCFLFMLLVGVKSLCEIGSVPYNYVLYIDFFENIDDLCHGIFDIRPFIFHITSGLLALLLGVTVLENKILR